MRNVFTVAFALTVLAASQSQAGTVTATVPVTVQQALALVFNPATPTIACNATPGTVVAAVSTTGGDGNAATFATSGGDTTDFVVNGTNVVVGPSGIAASSCGKTNDVTVTAPQN